MPPKRDLGASAGLLLVLVPLLPKSNGLFDWSGLAADSAGFAPKENVAGAGAVETAVSAGFGTPNSWLSALPRVRPTIKLALTFPPAGAAVAGGAAVFAVSKLNKEPAFGVLAPDCEGVADPCRGAAVGAAADTPKLKPVDAAGATGVTGVVLKKLGGAEASCFSAVDVEDGLPRPKSDPAVFLG